MKKKPDNICRLKYRLERVSKRSVKFEILYQDPRLRNVIPGIADEFYFDTKYTIRSVGYPAIRRSETNKRTTIFLRGWLREKDKQIFIYTGPLKIKEVHKALELMVEKVFGHCKRIEE